MRTLNILCVSTYFKGSDFMVAAKEAGNNVYLLTKQSLEHGAWPKEHIDDFFLLGFRYFAAFRHKTAFF